MEERKPARKPEKVDWPKAEAEYMADATLSYADIAKRHGTTKSSVERHAMKVKPTWAERRQTAGEEAVESVVESRKEEITRINEEHRTLYENLYKLANNQMERFQQMHDKKQDVPASELKNLAVAVKTSVEGVRVIVGLPILISKSDTTVSGEMKVTPDKASKAIGRWVKRQKKLKARGKA